MNSYRPMNRLLWSVAVVLTLAAPVAADAPRPAGYLAPGAFDVMAVLSPAPVKGDARYAADRAIFRTTRKFAGTPRWKMATDDVKAAPADMARDFSCALGVSLTPENAPHVVALIGRAGADAGAQTTVAKNINKRQRPFLIDKGQTCQPQSELADSYDYPSGHTTWGWTWAMILAELAPDHATAILARGRAYGESRIVCGAHNESAIEAGRLSATSTLAVVRTTPAYIADAAAARAELDALRQSQAAPPPSPEICKAEAALVAEDIFHPK